MNLIFRMIIVSIRSLFGQRLDIGRLQSTLSLRVLPNDLDLNLHMNNGRYLTLCDLSRVDLFIRTGLARIMIKHGWIPLIAHHTMTYKKPLGLFERFDLMLELTHWDEKYFYMKHVFMAGGKVAAEGTSQGCIYARKMGVITPADVIAALEASVEKTRP